MSDNSTVHESHSLTIRQATADDASLLAELGARTFSETFAADNTIEDIQTYLASAFSQKRQAVELADVHSLFKIAEIEGVPVGYSMLRRGRSPNGVSGANPIELVRLYVARESIGRGVGAALMQTCIDDAKSKGHDTLWLGVWENNHRAQAFYRKWNFRKVGTQVFQLGGDSQTDFLMQLNLFV